MSEYGMFTTKGNALVEKVIELSAEAGMSWSQTELLIECVSQTKGYEEMSDTAVCDEIYLALAR